MAPSEALQLPFDLMQHAEGFDNEGWYRTLEIPVDFIGLSQRKIAPAMSTGKSMVEAVADLILGHDVPKS